jgi:hypothetical protein
MEVCFGGPSGGGGRGGGQHVTLQFVGAAARAGGAAAAQWQRAAHSHAGGAGARGPSWLLPRRAADAADAGDGNSGGAPWRAVAAGVLLAANAAALAYLARRVYAAWAEAKAEEVCAERAAREHQEATRASLNYLQRLWEVAVQVRALGCATRRGLGEGARPRVGRAGACRLPCALGPWLIPTPPRPLRARRRRCAPPRRPARPWTSARPTPMGSLRLRGPTGRGSSSAPSRGPAATARTRPARRCTSGARRSGCGCRRRRCAGGGGPGQLWRPTAIVFGSAAARVALLLPPAAAAVLLTPLVISRTLPPVPPPQADSIWCDSGDDSTSPTLIGRLLIRRLELESQLVWGARCRAARAAAEPPAALPPLELPELLPFGGAPARRRAGKPRGSGPAADGRAAGGGGEAGGGGDGGGDVDGDGAFDALNDSVEALRDVPDSFICPLSQRVMSDPVTTPGEWGGQHSRRGRGCWIRPAGQRLCCRRLPPPAAPHKPLPVLPTTLPPLQAALPTSATRSPSGSAATAPTPSLATR